MRTHFGGFDHASPDDHPARDAGTPTVDEKAQRDKYARICPTCDGDGSPAYPFDGNCPAEWAHRYLAALPAASPGREAIKTAIDKLEVAMFSEGVRQDAARGPESLAARAALLALTVPTKGE